MTEDVTYHADDRHPELTATRTLPVDLETIAEIATEGEAYLDDTYQRTGYVDTVTGEVHVIYRDAFRCADGELELDQLEDWSAHDVELAGKILVDQEKRFVEIERWHSSDSYELMEAFVDEVRDARVRATLMDALQGRKPFRRFKDALCEWPDMRQRWFTYKDHAQRDRARAWLRRFGIEATDASAYKLPPLF